MGDVGRFEHAIRASDGPRAIDRLIAELAARQKGVVGRDQLLALGIGRGAIQRRLDAGRLHAIHPGVYAVGHRALGREGRWMAAVLACGPDALLSHRSAAALWGLRATERARIDVTTPRRSRERVAGVDLHRVRRLDPRDAATRDGIPCTTVARTILDLAEVHGPRVIERACEQAEVLRLFDLAALESTLERSFGRHGVPVVRAVLRGAVLGETVTRSELEERFVVLCDARGLPRPSMNVWVTLRGRSVLVDALWPTARLIVELDGWQSHRTRAAFERDRRRDADLLLAGYRVVRFTWRQILRSPGTVAGTLRALLAAG